RTGGARHQEQGGTKATEQETPHTFSSHGRAHVDIFSFLFACPTSRSIFEAIWRCCRKQVEELRSETAFVSGRYRCVTSAQGWPYHCSFSSDNRSSLSMFTLITCR